MQANSSITRGSGENGTSQHATTVHQPQNRNTPDQSQDTFLLNQTGKHGVMQGILGNSKSFGLLVGGNMSPGILNDACSGYTEIEQIFDYWMTGLDHVSNEKTGDAGQEFSHEVQKNLVGQEPAPVKQETKILTHTSKAGLSTQAGYCVRNPQWKCDSTEKENEKLEGSGLSGDPFVNRKGSLIGNACHQGNDKYYKHENLDLKDLPHSTPLENRRVFCASHIEMESRELKRKPQDIKGEDAFWSEGESLPQFDVWRESLKKGDCQHTSNEDIKPDCLDSKELFKAMPAENDHSPQVKMEGQKLKFEPQDIKKEDGFWSEGMGLPLFDLWRESLKKGDCQHTSNEDIKPDCLDSKELFKAMSAENHHSPQVKVEGQKLKFEPQDIKKEDGFCSEGMGLPQEQFGVCRDSLQKGDCQHTSNEDVKLYCLDSKGLFKATPVENHHRPQVKMEGQKLKFEPQDFKKEDGFWSEGMGLSQFDVWMESLKKGDCQHTSNEGVKPDCLDSKQLFKATPVENHHSPPVKLESQELYCEPQDFKKEDGFCSEGMGLSQDQFHVWRESFKDVRQYIDKGVKLSSADSKELLESLPFGNCSISQVEMESQELKCEPQNNCGQDVIWSKGVEFSQNQFDASFESDVHQHVSDKVARTDYPEKPICENHSISCVSQIKIENKKIKCEPRDMEEGEVMLSEALGHIKNERQELNKAERENIHKSGKRFVKTQISLESCQMETDHHFVRKQEKDVKPDSRNLEISPGLRNDFQNTFHVKHEREVNAEYLRVKKEDPVWIVNSIKQEIYTDGRSDCKVSVDPIWASHSLQTQSKIANTDNICNDKKSFPKNVPQCTKSVDFKAESYLKDEDPNWAFHCTRRKKVMTEDTSHLKSPPPSNSQTSDEFQRPSNMIASDPQQEAPVPVQQIFPSGFSHQVRTAQDPSVQTATQISPMLNQKEVAQKRAAQQSFQYSQGGKCFSRHDTLEAPKIMHENHPYIVEQLKQLSFCKLCGEKQILHLQKGDVLNGKIVLTPKCSSSKKQFWKCCSCKAGFRTQGRLNLHQRVHLRKLSMPKIKCPECEREFKNSYSLRKHSEVHIQGTVPCKLCDKVFRSETKLRSHHCRCHTAKTLACDKCEATFSTKASLFYHKAVHADRRLFECSDCKSKFKQKGHLKTHMLIHTDERPFPCLQCPSRFRTQAHLTAHMGRSLGCGAHSRPHRKPGRKRNRRKQELSDTETSEEVSATDVESTSPSDSDTSDTEG